METTDGHVVLGSESGLLDIPPAQIRRLGRLQPGKLFLVDLDVWGFKHRSSIRLKRHAERDILSLTGTDDSLDIGLVHVGLAAGHGFLLNHETHETHERGCPQARSSTFRHPGRRRNEAHCDLSS